MALSSDPLRQKLILKENYRQSKLDLMLQKYKEDQEEKSRKYQEKKEEKVHAIREGYYRSLKQVSISSFLQMIFA